MIVGMFLWGAIFAVIIGAILSVLFLLLFAVRSISSSFLPASATSLSGYGIARHRLWGPRFSAVPWYLAAVAMHSAFNGLAALGDYLSDPSRLGDTGILLALAGGIIFAFVAISVVRGKIMEHDARQGWVP